MSAPQNPSPAGSPAPTMDPSERANGGTPVASRTGTGPAGEVSRTTYADLITYRQRFATGLIVATVTKAVAPNDPSCVLCAGTDVLMTNPFRRKPLPIVRYAPPVPVYRLTNAADLRTLAQRAANQREFEAALRMGARR